MALEFRQRNVVMRVDGDVLEIFPAGSESVRVLLCWLAVSVVPHIKGQLLVRIFSTPDDVPLYEVVPKAKGMLGMVDEEAIRIEEEPIYRKFFMELAPLCGGRRVVPLDWSGLHS
jgi:hypothetical protein